MALITLSPYSLNSTLDYTFNNVSATGTVTSNSLTVSNATGVVNFTTTANVTLGNVSNLHISGGTNGYVLQTDGAGTLSWVVQSGGGGSPGGSNTQVQFNDSSAFGGNAGLTFDKTTTTLTANNFVATSTANLGSNANVIITGGTNGYVLSTNGSGVLTWVAQSGGGGGGASISNGSSNVNIPTANGNVSTSVGGVANVFVVTTAGVNITGNLTAGAGTGGNITGGNLISANYFSGDGGLLSNITASGATSIASGTSNVSIPSANGNITMGVSGTSNVVVVSNTGITALILPRIVTYADATSITINAANTDTAVQTNTQAVGTFTINAPTGTLSDGQKLMFRLQSTNVQTFSWNAVFDGSTDLNLPTTSSGSSAYDYMGFMYNSGQAKWNMISKNFGF